MIADCEYCDFIGPFVSAEQPLRDFHRQWHDMIRSFNRLFGPLIKAFNDLSEASQNKMDYTLLTPPKGDSK